MSCAHFVQMPEKDRHTPLVHRPVKDRYNQGGGRWTRKKNRLRRIEKLNINCEKIAADEQVVCGQARSVDWGGGVVGGWNGPFFGLM